MESGTHDRGVSEVVGFILLFGMLVTAFTVYQGIIVPDQNRQVEFQHNQEVQGQIQDLRNAIVSTAATGSGQAVSVTLGASYPTRALAMNLGVSAGSLQTTRGGGQGVVIRNVSTQDGQTADYVSGTLGPFPTSSIRYTPVYSFYTEAPDTIYENSLVYNRFDGANITVTDQILFDGRDVTIVTLNGSLSAAQRDTVSVNTRPISVSSTRVPVSSNGSGPVTITVPTRLSASKWEEILGEEYDPTGSPEDGHVTAVRDAGPNAVEFVLETGVDYDLRLARIGVGNGVDSTSAHYITAVSGNESNVPTDGTQQLVVEVRDEYNNPVSGAVVNVSDGPVADTDNRAVTGADGRARFTFDPATTGAETVTMNISGSPAAREMVTFQLNVHASSGGGGGGGGAFDLSWQNPSDAAVSGCTPEPCIWDADVDDHLTLIAETKPSLDGIGLDFAVSDSTIAQVQMASEQTAGNGEGSVVLNAVTNGTVGVFVAAGGTSDRLDIVIENVHPDVVYNQDVETTDSDSSTLEFSITNQFSENIHINGITVDDAGAADYIESDSSEITITATNDGAANTNSNNGYDTGDRIDLTDRATMASGTSADIAIGQFRYDFFSIPTDMSGRDVTITVHFEEDDGDTFTRTYTMSVP